MTSPTMAAIYNSGCLNRLAELIQCSMHVPAHSQIRMHRLCNGKQGCSSHPVGTEEQGVGPGNQSMRALCMRPAMVIAQHLSITDSAQGMHEAPPVFVDIVWRWMWQESLPVNSNIVAVCGGAVKHMLPHVIQVSAHAPLLHFTYN